MPRKPSPYDVHRGECDVRFPGTDDSVAYHLTVAWEVEAESLDYRIVALRALVDDEEVLYLGPEKINDPGYISPRYVRTHYDKAIREAIWNEIGPSIPFISENRYVN